MHKRERLRFTGFAEVGVGVGWQAEGEGVPSCGKGKHQLTAWGQNAETQEAAANVTEVGLAGGQGRGGGCGALGSVPKEEDKVGLGFFLGCVLWVSADLGDDFATGFPWDTAAACTLPR